MTLAPHIARARLAAEAAWLARLNSGFGFADPRLPGQIYLRDAGAQARLAKGSLKPDGSHRRQAEEVAAALAAAATTAAAHGSRLADVTTRLALAPLDADVLAIVVAYELDLDTRELVHALAPRRRAALWVETLVEVAAALGHPVDAAAVLAVLHPAGPLLAAGLVRVDGHGLAQVVFGTESALRWLVGDDRLDDATAAVATLVADDGDLGVRLPPAALGDLDRVATRLRARDGATAIVLHGPRGAGRRAAAHHLARALGRPLLVVHGTRLRRSSEGAVVPRLADLLALAALRGALAFVLDADALLGGDGELGVADGAAVRRHPDPIVVGIGATSAHLELGRPTLAVRLPRAELADREHAWRDALARHGASGGDAVADELAARYVIGPGAVAEVTSHAADAARLAGEPLATAHLEASVGARLSLRLGAFGQVVTRKARFAEMVLPEDVKSTLDDVIAMVRQRAQILERWGYQRHLGISRGVAALFSGDPGTGKTMAASVIASELGLELVRIDLSAVVSKFVGETEKHLAKIFDEAQDAHAMLLFDEADGLFGKRTEVKTAQDRFANLEVNYLLQRMETFDGVSVLTTNLESSIDPALLRRLNFRVRFPAPERDERVLLWERLLPPAAMSPAARKQLDLGALADQFVMTGGYIKNAVVRAAVFAARAGREIGAEDLLAAAHHEYAEMGKVMPTLPRPPRPDGASR